MLKPTCVNRAASELERRVQTHAVALEPAHVARVDDEPALAGRHEPGVGALERGLGNHRL